MLQRIDDLHPVKCERKTCEYKYLRKWEKWASRDWIEWQQKKKRRETDCAEIFHSDDDCLSIFRREKKSMCTGKALSRPNTCSWAQTRMWSHLAVAWPHGLSPVKRAIAYVCIRDARIYLFILYWNFICAHNSRIATHARPHCCVCKITFLWFWNVKIIPIGQLAADGLLCYIRTFLSVIM